MFVGKKALPRRTFLRAMGATNILQARSRRPLSRPALEAARAAFLGGNARAIEQIEILHFAGWKAAREL